MIKKLPIVLFGILFLVTSGEAKGSTAQLYSCITIEGTRFFTNDPAFIPLGCDFNL